MSLQEAKELHDLFFTFMGMFHEKFLFRFRREFNYQGLTTLKKNHQKIINILYQKEYQTCTDIGKKLDIEKGSLTTLIDQLAEWGLVTRCSDPNDRRKIFICLTEKGQHEMESVMDFYAEKMNEFFKDVRSEDMQEFVASLKNVVNFMKKM